MVTQPRKGYVLRVLLVHGLLLVVVLGVVTVSLRFQYAALRDQTAGEQQTEQTQAARQTATLAETYFRARIAELFRRNDAWSPPATAPTTGPARDDVGVSTFSRRLQRQVGTNGRGQNDALDRSAVSFLKSVDKISVGGPFEVGGGEALLLAAPGENDENVVFTPLTSAQLAAWVLSPVRRSEGRSVALIDEKGVTLAGDDLVAAAGPIDRRLHAALKQMRETGAGVNDNVAGTDAAWLSVQPVAVVRGRTWAVAIVSGNEAVDERLQPLVTRLVTWTALVAIAVTVVLASTAAGLIRVRRRVENLRREMLNRDLAKARRIQLNWLPSPRQTTEYLDMAAENRPALHISGDFYNWIDLPGEIGHPPRTAIVLGDVTGHGLPAAFLMATTQMLVRSTMLRVGDPGVCLTEVNQQLASLVYNGQFVTMLIMVIDHERGEAAIASAGQGPPLFCPRGGCAAGGWDNLPVEPQLVLGVDESMTYETNYVALSPGSSLLLYTDGVTEATDGYNHPFGLDRLKTALSTSASADPVDLVASVSSALAAFAGNTLDDDLTLVALRLHVGHHTTAGNSPHVNSPTATA